MFHPDPPKKVLYFYGIHQALFDQMECELPFLTFHKGLRSEEDMDILSSQGGHNMIILDDLMQKVVQDAECQLLFTQRLTTGI